MQQDVQPDAVAITFDMRAPTFRHKLYDGYKAQRKGMPDELAQQMPPLKELLGYLGYVIVEREGFEADDLLGTLAAGLLRRPAITCVIATGDRDSRSSLSIRDCVTVRLAATRTGRPSRPTFYDDAAIRERLRRGRRRS